MNRGNIVNIFCLKPPDLLHNFQNVSYVETMISSQLHIIPDEQNNFLVSPLNMVAVWWTCVKPLFELILVFFLMQPVYRYKWRTETQG